MNMDGTLAVASYEKFMWPGTLTVRLDLYRFFNFWVIRISQNIAEKSAIYHAKRHRSRDIKTTVTDPLVQRLNLQSVGALKQ